MFCVSVCLVPERERKRDIKGEGGVETGKEEEREKVVVNNPTVSWKKKKTIPQSPTTCNCKLSIYSSFLPAGIVHGFHPKTAVITPAVKQTGFVAYCNKNTHPGEP